MPAISGNDSIEAANVALRWKVEGVEMVSNAVGERCSVTLPEGAQVKPGDVLGAAIRFDGEDKEG